MHSVYYLHIIFSCVPDLCQNRPVPTTLKLELTWTLTIIIIQLKKQDSISVGITKLSNATQVELSK